METFSKKSANIALSEYDRTKQELFITFKSFKDPNATTKYKYSQVPEKVWNALKAAESTGNFVNNNIKGVYDYQKV